MAHSDDPILIREYDPTWPDQFDEIAARTRTALGDLVVRIEHIGSTAVPGLAAKPVVDLDVVVSPQDVFEAILRLTNLGYVHEGNLGIAEREAFRPPPGDRRHHLYLVPETSAALQRHVAFRDALRADPTLRAKYAALKRTLAAQHRDNRDAYSEAKSGFITDALSSIT
jgi:GrpB-like predicted nucleotidyltransferase (UPF0157 family)